MALLPLPHDSGPVWIAKPSPYDSFIHYTLPVLTGALETVYYQVRKGDTLWSISEKFLGSGLAYPTLVKLNGLKNPDRIAIGQKLKITKLKTDG